MSLALLDVLIRRPLQPHLWNCSSECYFVHPLNPCSGSLSGPKRWNSTCAHLLNKFNLSCRVLFAPIPDQTFSNSRRRLAGPIAKTSSPAEARPADLYHARMYPDRRLREHAPGTGEIRRTKLAARQASAFIDAAPSICRSATSSSRTAHPAISKLGAAAGSISPS